MYLSADEIRHHYPPSLRCEDVTKLTGIDTATVRECLINGRFPFGFALKKEGEKSKWRFVIPTERFLAWFEGKDMQKCVIMKNSEAAGI